MANYTLSSYEEALKVYDQNAQSLKDWCSKEVEDLREVFDRTQNDVENDQFLSSSEKKRILKKRQEWFEKLKREREKQLRADLDIESKKKEDFIAQDWWFDYHCFTTLCEISRIKEEKVWEVNEEIVKKQEELARLQAEIQAKQQEVDNLQLDLWSIQSKTLHEAFFDFDVMPRIKEVEKALNALVVNHKNDYKFPQDFVSRTIRCLTKECKKEKELLNYEWWKLKLSFDTVENWTKWEDEKLKGKVISILTDCGFVVSKMGWQGLNLSNKSHNSVLNPTLPPMFPKRNESELASKLYLKEILHLLDKDDIQWRINIIKQLSFSFADEPAFIKQVETARSEWVDLLEDIDKWIELYIQKPGGIEQRITDNKKEYFKISLDCKQRNPRILMTMEIGEWMKILCVAPHIDYDNILRWQTTNYFQTRKWHWTIKWKQWRKTGRA